MLEGRPLKKRMIINLRNEGKTIREIAKETNTSFRDIGAVLNEANENAEDNVLQMQRRTYCAEAFELFKEGKDRLDVAITLKLKQPEVADYYEQYLKLKGLDDFVDIVRKIKDDVGSLIKLYKMMRSVGMDVEHVRRLLDIANNHLPSVESEYQRIRMEIRDLELKRMNLEGEIQKIKQEISYSHSTLSDFRNATEEETDRIKRLKNERLKLKSDIAQFKISDEAYLKIKEIVEEKLLDNRELIRSAFLSLVQSIRNDPAKYASMLFFDKKDELSHLTYTINYFNGYYYGQGPYSSQKHTSADYREMLIEEAEKLYSKLIEESVEDVIEVYPSRIESSSRSSLPALPSINEGLQDNNV